MTAGDRVCVVHTIHRDGMAPVKAGRGGIVKQGSTAGVVLVVLDGDPRPVAMPEAFLDLASSEVAWIND